MIAERIGLACRKARRLWSRWRYPARKRRIIMDGLVSQLRAYCLNPQDSVSELDADESLVSIYYLAFWWDYCDIATKALMEVRSLDLPQEFEDWRMCLDSDAAELAAGRRLRFRAYFDNQPAAGRGLPRDNPVD